MLNNKIVLALAAASFVAAQEIERNDIPQECRSICEPVIDISRRCNFDNDQRERDCICDVANNASFATCNECTLRYPQFFVDTDNDNDDINDVNDNDDNEVANWYNRCAFGGNSTTAPGASITSAPTPPLSMSTGVYTTTICDDDVFDNDNDLDDDRDTPDNDDVCRTRVMTGAIPVVPVTATTTDASGSTVTSSFFTTTSTGTRGPQATQTGQTGTGAGSSNSGNGNGNNDANGNNDLPASDGGAMAMAIPMLWAGAGMVFVALAYI
uniref:Extracellular membrane protein CFEM domain-containing protein n=1 Tax=Ramularia collo-cygni TaxID=112498 RepID=A0A2D3V9L8_9PEZI